MELREVDTVVLFLVDVRKGFDDIEDPQWLNMGQQNLCLGKGI